MSFSPNAKESGHLGSRTHGLEVAKSCQHEESRICNIKAWKKSRLLKLKRAERLCYFSTTGLLEDAVRPFGLLSGDHDFYPV